MFAGFVCFVVLNPCVLSANKIGFINFPVLLLSGLTSVMIIVALNNTAVDMRQSAKVGLTI